ncbi:MULTISPECIES: imidazolonepropionase [Tsukamurella]|uniref:Imidazolonepropionase n=2 Tax=Tsukamurella TaxID=2060 RepID=A0A5C5RZQ8_9ACTN|nr:MULTISPECIES: imidazolonepropionase [Tsukamurella]NMD54729.1 imidazolonepropionase [Tsukamurella columbiensis]TWS28637.1 imidazolonepropionase [Tsukamurella conjunctivitidis]
MTTGWTLIDGIGSLVTNDPQAGEGRLGVIRDAAVVIGDGAVQWVGPSSRVPDGAAAARIDVEGRAVLPGFVDSHSHTVFGGDRAEEFAARMTGAAYGAGGIRTTIAATRAASDEALAANTARLAAEARAQGTTTLEIKTGYGQTVRDESRSLDVAAGVSDEVTLLAAHVAPPEYAGRQDDYVAMVIDEMIPACAPRATWIDVFCEEGAFTEEQSRAVLTAGMAAGLVPRVHGNQLSYGAGVRLAVELGAASVDHVTYTTEADVDALASGMTVATLLPGADFSTRNKYPDARALLDAGVTVALAADCNPGTSYTTSIPFCIALAVREMHMSPDEAVWAATAGGAAALRRTDVGALRVGMRADLTVLDAPSHLHLAYRPGVPLVSRVFSAGVQR